MSILPLFWVLTFCPYSILHSECIPVPRTTAGHVRVKLIMASSAEDGGDEGFVGGMEEGPLDIGRNEGKFATACSSIELFKSALKIYPV